MMWLMLLMATMASAVPAAQQPGSEPAKPAQAKPDVQTPQIAILRPPRLGGGLGTAETMAQADSKLTLGVFRPITIRLGERTDLQTTGLIGSLVSPHVQIKQQLIRQSSQQNKPLSVAMVASINTPTPILTLAKGWLYTPDANIPFALQGKLGVLASRRYRYAVLSAGAYFRAGMTAGESDLTPRDFYFIDAALAPIAEGPVGVFDLQGDLHATSRLLLRIRLSMQVGSEDGIDLQSRTMALLAPSNHTAFGLGLFTHRDPRPNGTKHYFVPGADFMLRY